ncbi:hypothetical protein HPB51_016506 [Rhipicephalus microplus]|uniref:Uncharacterized protein n=1 Tax=Rhipicephalus microplus TaxID=6941 RepID=A0A9J6E2L8_RHIMP|nr:hypothetical protein HPB51_016506 [Rhipicephalus microplus]
MALNAATDQQYHLLDQDGTADDQMDQLQSDHDTVSRDAIGAQSHADEDASWQAAKSTKKRKQEELERRRGSAGLQDQVKRGTPTFKKLPKLPPLPKDDYKIVIRPNQGLPLRNILTPTLAQAIIEACQAGIRDDHFILRINPGSNIAILSTKYEEVADKVRLIRALVLNGRAHAVRAYAANGDDTLRGVIHGVPMNTSTETLMAHLRVRTHAVEIITARMIGTTKSAAITFFGPTLPRTVYYYGVAPRAGRLTPQEIQLAKKRLKPPKPKQPQVQADHSDKLQQGTSNDPPRTKNLRWFSSEEEENAYKSADDKQRSRSRSRSPGRKPHPPSKKSAPAPTQQNLYRGPPGGGAKGNGGDQGCTQQASSLPVSWAEAVAPKSACTPPITQNVHYQAVIAENKQLKQRLDKYENKIMWLEKQLAQLLGATPKTIVQASQNQTSHPSEKLRDNGHIQPQSTPPRDPVANIGTEQTATNPTLQQQLQLMQQHILQQTEAQMKQFFVEFQDLKRYVHESLDKETKRRRKQSQTRSQESDAKSMLTSDAESTPTSSHHGN